MVSERKNTKKAKIITKNGYQQYRQKLKNEQISKIMGKGSIQESYDEWAKTIENSIKEVQQPRKKNPRKDIRELQKIRKTLRREINEAPDIYQKNIIRQRINLIKEHIVEKKKEARSSKIKKIAEDIRNNVDNGGKIWEVKRKLMRKDKPPHYIKNENGNIIDNKEEMVKEYEKYYSNLLKTRSPETNQEQQAEQKVEEEFRRIMEKSEKEVTRKITY